MHDIDVSIDGVWGKVPALHLDNRDVVSTGRVFKLASINAEEWQSEEIACPDDYLRALRDRGVCKLKADLFTFSQHIPNVEPKHPYYFELDSIAVTETTDFQAWWSSVPQETRKNVRRAEKRGVTALVVNFLDDSLVQKVVDLNNDSPIRQGKSFVHYGKSFEQVKRDQSTFFDRSEFVCAFLGDELIGFMKIVYRNKIASILQFLPKASHADKRPANVLIAKAVERCQAKGIEYLTYGRYRYGNKNDSSLLQFKMRNGFREMNVPRYYVPLTPLGRVVLKLSLHRGLLGLLPNEVIRGGVQFRTWLYGLRSSISRRCSSTVERSNSNRLMECSIPPAGSTAESHTPTTYPPQK